MLIVRGTKLLNFPLNFGDVSMFLQKISVFWPEWYFTQNTLLTSFNLFFFHPRALQSYHQLQEALDIGLSTQAPVHIMSSASCS